MMRLPRFKLTWFSTLSLLEGFIQCGHRYNSDEHVVRQSHNLLVIVGVIVMIRPSGQGIGMVTNARYVFQLIIEILKEADISSHPSIDLLQVSVILQVCVVS